MSRPSRNRNDKLSQIPYCNVMIGGKLQNISLPMDYWTVLSHMSEKLIELPIIRQIGGSCVMYSIQTAKQIADNTNYGDPICSAKIKKDGAQMRNQLRHLVNRDGVKARYKEYNVSRKSNQMKCIQDIIKALSRGEVVVSGGGPALAQDTSYAFPSKTFKMGKRRIKNIVPIFNHFRAGFLEHNICIIGCYNDAQEGPSFLTKMTNFREGPIPNIRVGGTKLKIENLCYGILPIKNLLNKKLYLTEFASLPMSKQNVFINLTF